MASERHAGFAYGLAPVCCPEKGTTKTDTFDWKSGFPEQADGERGQSALPFQYVSRGFFSHLNRLISSDPSAKVYNLCFRRGILW
jgi:hypothetical protein